MLEIKTLLDGRTSIEWLLGVKTRPVAPEIN
jgi:hypothetical protein